MSAILADYNTTQELVQNHIENEVNNLTEEIQAIRTTVYKSLRNNYEDTELMKVYKSAADAAAEWLRSKDNFKILWDWCPDYKTSES